MHLSSSTLLILLLLPLASSFLTAPALPRPLRAPASARECSPASLRMQAEGSRRSLLASTLGASLALLVPQEASAGGLASMREAITGEKAGMERASVRQQVSATKNPCEFFNCVEVDEDLFKSGGVSNAPVQVAPGVSIRVPNGWEEAEASGNTVAAYADGKGGRVSVVKSGDGYIKLKDVDGKPAPIASAALKVDVVQTGNRLVKLFGADSFINGTPRYLTPQNVLIYSMSLKSQGETLLLSVAQSKDDPESAWIVTCRCKTESIKKYKQTFGAVLQSIALQQG